MHPPIILTACTRKGCGSAGASPSFHLEKDMKDMRRKKNTIR